MYFKNESFPTTVTPASSWWSPGPEDDGSTSNFAGDKWQHLIPAKTLAKIEATTNRQLTGQVLMETTITSLRTGMIVLPSFTAVSSRRNYIAVANMTNEAVEVPTTDCCGNCHRKNSSPTNRQSSDCQPGFTWRKHYVEKCEVITNSSHHQQTQKI